MPVRSKRLLAAVMFTDMVGFTQMMQADERRAMLLRDKHRDVLRSALQQFNGEMVQYFGDGTLSIFPSTVDAAAAGISIQKALAESPKVPLRIGLHVGDIAHDEEGIYGDGVNLASRIESLAVPGSLFISEKVYDDLKNHSEFELEPLGNFEFKNVDRPIGIYAVVNSPLVRPLKAALKGKIRERIRSVAVLPFSNMSADPDNEFFSDGMSEELLNALTRIEGLQVTSRTSCFAFKGKNIDVREIGRQLQVETVIEGSVRKSGQRVRITVQMINAGNGYHLWSETFDRDLDDVFAVQEEISRLIAKKLTLSDRSRAIEDIKASTQDLGAYSGYLQAKYHWHKWTPEDMRLAISKLEAVIRDAPDFAAAHSAMASCLVFLGVTGNMDPVRAFQRAKDLAKRAIELDPESSDSLASLGAVYFLCEYQWDLAEHYFDRSLDVNPNSADNLQLYAMYLLARARMDEAEEKMSKALKLDPLSPSRIFYMGLIRLASNDIDGAMEYFERALEVDPNFRSAVESKGMAMLQVGDLDAAETYFRQFHQMVNHPLRGITGLGLVSGLRGHTAQAQACIDKLRQRLDEDPDQALDIDFAILYRSMGMYDLAIDYLESALEKRMGVFFIRTNPLWDPLRPIPRFQALVRRFGIDD